jgi:hypothetical protein
VHSSTFIISRQVNPGGENAPSHVGGILSPGGSPYTHRAKQWVPSRRRVRFQT